MSTNEPMTQEQLDAIRERTEKATEGPWDVEGPAYCGPLDTLVVYPVEDGGALAYVQPSWEDAEFIAHARQDVPALLAEVERLRAVIKDQSRAWDAGCESGSIATMLNLSYGVIHQPANPYEQEEA